MKAYSIKNGHFIISMLPAVPPHRVGGYAAGDDVMTIEFNDDAVITEVGADGQMTVSFSADESATITLKLAQTSKSNAVLDRCANLQRSVNGALDFAPLVIGYQDVYRQDAAAGAFGVVKKKPPMKRGKKA
jgi:hypothetical protein